MNVKEIKTENILTVSKMKGYDYVINPYIGCDYDCKYCYACFMRRFAKHTDLWGEFLDVKTWEKPIEIKKLAGKKVLLSSVTEPYNTYEKNYRRTRRVLEELQNAECEITIQTKSDLVLRDLDLLKKMQKVKVGFSFCSFEEKLSGMLEGGSSVNAKLKALKKLHKNNIKTICFISPFMPVLTDFRDMIERSKSFVDEFVFENLALRNEFKPRILNFIWKEYPELLPLYKKIYKDYNQTYWKEVKNEINDFCLAKEITFVDNITVAESLISRTRN